MLTRWYAHRMRIRQSGGYKWINIVSVKGVGLYGVDKLDKEKSLWMRKCVSANFR